MQMFGSEKENKQERLEKINQEIEQLEKMKRGYEARALKQEDSINYLQFNDDAKLETRRLIQLANENHQKAKIIKEKIDDLKLEKKALEN